MKFVGDMAPDADTVFVNSVQIEQLLPDVLRNARAATRGLGRTG